MRAWEYTHVETVAAAFSSAENRSFSAQLADGFSQVITRLVCGLKHKPSLKGDSRISNVSLSMSVCRFRSSLSCGFVPSQ
jgi:hypothetical protein